MPTINTDTLTTIMSNGAEVRTLKVGSTFVYSKILLNFDENFGSSVSNYYVYFPRTYGQYTNFPTPVRSGYIFKGWFPTESNNNGTGTRIYESDAVTDTSGGTKTIYAQWDLAQQKTATPTILSATSGKPPFVTQGYRVRNNDTSTATIYSEENDSTPDVSRGSVAYNATTAFISMACQPGNCNRTVYATAQASGETLSNVRSMYFQ